MKKLTLSDVLEFLPKNTIVINDAFYNENTHMSGALVFSILKSEKYNALLKKTVIAMNPVPYKRKVGLSVTLK